MTRPNEHHDTITSGLRIVAERPNGDGTYSPVDDPDATSPGGTISIIAKDRDGNAVLVTNAHVITGLRNSQPAGGDRVYHHEISGSRHIATVPQWDILRPAWVHRKGGLEGDGNNRMDVGYAVLESGVGVKFALHGHDDQHLPGETINVHTDRRIVPGTYDPSIGDKLVFLGRNSGEHKVTVTGLNSRQEVTGFRYIGLVSFSSTVDLIGGDSGAGLYRKVGDEYQLSCIFFTASNDRRTGYAFRASEAAEALGLTFGNRPPIAHAGPNRVINSNNPVILEGSVDDPDSADRNYVTQNHTWTQDSGPVTITLDPVADEPVHRTFTPEVVGEYFFTLTATDQEPLSASDTVRVSVWPSAQSVLPTRVRATAAARSVALGWTGPSIATGYEVEIGIPASAGGLGHTSHTTTGTTITIENLTPQQTYEYRVRMTNSDGVGPWTDWATVVTPGETPPKPTGDQWDVRYLNNKIQVKLTELPAVIPAISQVKAFLGTGLEPDLTTVEKEVGTTLNQWIDVLTSRETDWRTGRWLAQIRFVNTSSSLYSIGKSVTVPNHPPVAFAGYNDIVLPNTTVYLRGSSKDPDRHLATEMDYNWSLVEDVTETPGRSTTRVPQVTPLITIASPTSRRTSFTAPAQAQTLRIRLTVTDPNGATDTDDVITQVHSGVGTTEWLDTRATRGCGATRDKEQMRRIDRRPHGEYRWTADPEDEVWSAWEDTDQTRNRNEGDWTDTDPLETMGTPPDVEKKQTRTITWEQEQTRTSETCGTIETKWLEASDTETRWVVNSPGPWEDVDPPVCQGCGPTKEKKQQRDNNGVTEYQWLAIPEPLVWTDWEDVVPSETRNRVEGDWEDTGRVQTDPVIDVDEKEQTRTITYDKRQRSANQCDEERFSWLGVSETQTRWVEGTPVLVPTSVPNNITADPSARSVDISWDPVARATGYVVEIGIPPSAGGLGPTSDTTTGTSITISNLLPWTTYEYRVKATAEGRIGTWSGWATVVTPKEDPLTPTNDQWDIEYDSDNKIQAKVISLPAVIPAISEARVSMEIGQPPNPVTVTKAIGVSLGTWVDVLTSADANWQSGTWAAHLRFENSVGNSRYSLPGKPVIVPAVPTTPPPIIDPDPWGDWVDALPPNNTRNEVIGAWTDTGNQRENQVLLIMEKEQTRTITWEKRQERTSQSGNRTESRWVDASRTETQWVPGIIWEDVVPPVTRNRVEGSWSDTDETRWVATERIFERKQTRVVTWEKKQRNANNHSQTRWVRTSTTQTQWVEIIEVCGSWSDTGQTRVDRYGSWSRTGRTRGSGANKECQERRTVYREKQQSCTTNAPYNNTRYRWVSTSSTTATQWVDCPEEVWPTTWTDTGSIENFDAGTWRDLSTTQGCGPNRERKQIRIATWRKEQFQTSNLGNRRTRWVSASRISFRWRDYPEALRWGSWTDTGQQRENQVLLIIEKEQERTSHCGDTQTRWVYVSG